MCCYTKTLKLMLLFSGWGLELFVWPSSIKFHVFGKKYNFEKTIYVRFYPALLAHTWALSWF